MGRRAGPRVKVIEESAMGTLLRENA
jgi:hypothetical protein